MYTREDRCDLSDRPLSRARSGRETDDPRSPPRGRESRAHTAHARSPTMPTKRVQRKAGKKGKGATEPESHPCFHCQSEGAKMCCSQCHLAWYCGKPFQKKHWKQHKKVCVAAVAAEARRAVLARKATEARGGGDVDKETCVICVGPVVAPVDLPCGHAHCAGCLAELRVKKAAQASFVF